MQYIGCVAPHTFKFDTGLKTMVGCTLQPQAYVKQKQILSDGRLGKTDNRKTQSGEEKNLLEIFMIGGEFYFGRNTDKII